ncbi:MAG: hypothetical protein AB7H88_05600 [Vicinamibacterales bacterium]
MRARGLSVPGAGAWLAACLAGVCLAAPPALAQAPSRARGGYAAGQEPSGAKAGAPHAGGVTLGALVDISPDDPRRRPARRATPESSPARPAAARLAVEAPPPVVVAPAGVVLGWDEAIDPRRTALVNRPGVHLAWPTMP